MAKVYYTLNENDQPSEESLARMAALKDRPIDYSDIPKYTSEELEEMRRLAVEKRKKQLFSLRLQTSVINWWRQNVGIGYTSVMARMLEKATQRTDWIKECL
jgi:uncharacterized protein (DUF4415 family)